MKKKAYYLIVYSDSGITYSSFLGGIYADPQATFSSKTVAQGFSKTFHKEGDMPLNPPPKKNNNASAHAT